MSIERDYFRQFLAESQKFNTNEEFCIFEDLERTKEEFFKRLQQKGVEGSEDLFQKLISLDPTTNGNTAGKFTSWILNQYLKGNIDLENQETMIELTASLKNLMEQVKIRNKDVILDIGRFKTVDEFIQYQNEHPYEKTDRQKRKELSKVDTTSNSKEVDIIYQDDEWILYVPLTYEASVKLGRNTNWCTAYSGNSYYFDSYSSTGPLVIIQNKKDQLLKYQYHKESSSLMDKNDKRIRIKNLPENIVNYLESPEFKNYRTNYRILYDEKLIEAYNGTGDLNLKHSKIRKLPDSLRVINGSLTLYQSAIESLPEGLQVNGNLELSESKITSLPENLKVGGDLDLSHTEITSLPEDLEVGGNLELSESKITSLPENLKVGGDLYLDNTEITLLPEDLKVDGDLRLCGSKIASIPKRLQIDGDLDLSYTEITSLPEDLKINGTLILSQSKITSLPENLKVGGSLFLDNTEITSLPENLKVDGSLDLSHTEITSLPENLKVGGDLYLDNTEITSLPKGLQVGSIVINRKIYKPTATASIMKALNASRN